jgi:exodeoxyribonuclease-1
MPFIFYDTETTGIDTTFDQILQFAAILTDDALSELDRFNYRCRLQPHVIPAPGALLATRVTPAMLTDPALPTHYQTMCEIARHLRNWAPAIFIGYNTISFDEPLLRQAFYQTLQPVYLTNTGGNTRADVLRLVQATTVLAPGAIAVPENDNGKPTLKLDRLAPANGYDHANAHDALADVEATIHMSRLVRERAPSVWKALMPLANKNDVLSRALTEGPQCLVEYHMGRPSARAVIGCGQNPENQGMLAVFDLSNDPAVLFDLDDDELPKAMRGSSRTIRIIHANKMPALADLSLAQDIDVTNGIPAQVIAERARQVLANIRFQKRVSRALASYYPPSEPARIVEQRIYEGFPGRADEERMRTFHRLSWPERARLAESLEDDRLRELARRLVFIEEPAALDPTVRAQFEAWLSNRRYGREGVTAGRTLSDALAEAEKMAAEIPAAQAGALEEIRDWLTGLQDGATSA